MPVQGPFELVDRCTRYRSTVAPPLLSGRCHVSVTLELPTVVTGDRGAVGVFSVATAPGSKAAASSTPTALTPSAPRAAAARMARHTRDLRYIAALHVHRCPVSHRLEASMPYLVTTGMSTGHST